MLVALEVRGAPGGRLPSNLAKVMEAAGKVKEVYGYFNNHFHGYAVENCLQVMEMLGLAGEAQREAGKAIEDFRGKKVSGRIGSEEGAQKGGTLDRFI